MDALACNFELQEEKCCNDARHIKNEHAKQMVKVFAWTSNGGNATVFSFQSGFIWPFFNLSYDILQVVELLEASDQYQLQVVRATAVGFDMEQNCGVERSTSRGSKGFSLLCNK